MTKFIDFKVVERIEKVALDIWAYDTQSAFQNKFIVFTSKRRYELFRITGAKRARQLHLGWHGACSGGAMNPVATIRIQVSNAPKHTND